MKNNKMEKEKEKEASSESDLAGWCSTHGLITAQRIFELYKIKLQTEDLIEVIKTSGSFYHAVLMIPMRNVFNGIILQQIRDYQLYAQKLFIDYLLSGSNHTEDENESGATTREDIAIEQGILTDMNNNLHDMEFEQERMIAKSQSALIQKVKEWNQLVIKIQGPLREGLFSLNIQVSEHSLRKALVVLLTRYNFKKKTLDKKEIWAKIEQILDTTLNTEAQQFLLEEVNTLNNFVMETEKLLEIFSDEVKAITQQLRQMRSDFYNFIVRAKELLFALPNYNPTVLQDISHRETLFFDPSLGENL